MSQSDPSPANETETAGARLSADIGGTFTDIVLERGDRRWSCKVLTTPKAPEDAVLAGIERLLAESAVRPSEVDRFLHGMTLATNAILERRGAKTALLTTQGFRDVLEIGDEGRFDPSDLRLQKPRPLIPRELRFAVPERMAANGEVLIPLDEAAVAEAAARIGEAAGESVAIGFLHSYANPAHEQQAAEIVRRVLPDISISLSSEVCPEIREYERLSTVAANAYVQQLVVSYLTRLSARLEAAGIGCPAFLMTSGRGVMPFDLAMQVPIRLVESGPAGGAVLSASIAEEMGEKRILSFDMGGTTAKICFISDGTPQIARSFEVDRAARFRKGSGLPVRIPVIELVEIGAGGGSIVSVDATRRIAVGPQSAGSDPGPSCYGKGGRKPTVTDGDLLLGKIDPSRFAGGQIRLDAAQAEAAFGTDVAGKLALDTTEAAFGAVEIVDETMANAAKVHAVELGCELSDHAMVAFGGAAPLHAARLAEKLGIGRVIIPKGAGVGSALGFLRAPISYEVAASQPMRLGLYDQAAVADLLARMWQTASEMIGEAAERFSGVAVTTTEMRYVGQGHEVTVGAGDGVPTAAALRTAFEEAYRQLFGRTIEGAPIEILSWKVALARPTWSPGRSSTAEGEPRRATPVATRPVFDPGAGLFLDHSVYERSALRAGDEVPGPALIVEDETTTVVTPGFRARVSGLGHLVLERNPEGRA
ncbi:hydantoinase/oxoprolinase family protein [Acuticoccus mangrovi]|uniref:Hydantoinase/oxoprolinase family protein n=1 Tax=Acuticoccus mangrovi TaxID=2796142 RepID=A0A934MP83_9HYPH|nr:hydantoinase/oxoprolinase family protein [Acuticoccus mangrovi]MBJ3778874.1 hydantoinase/oxoprolinase family protein [Acuticoccus mangrovi]